MKTKRNERGQAIILIVLAILGMVGLVALAIDGGNAFSDRRHAQNAADAAALAAALVKANNGSAEDINEAALGIALSNGYGYQVTTVNNPPTAGCDGQNSLYTGNNDYVQVIIHSEVDTYFAGVVGVSRLQSCVEAIAYGSSSTWTPLFFGAGMAALKPTGNDGVYANGNINLNVINSGVFVNADGSCAMTTRGNVNLDVDTAYSIHGGYCKSGIVNVVGPVQTGMGGVPYPPAISVPPPSINCTQNGYRVGTTYYPGNYSSIDISGINTYTFTPGNYCISGGVSIRGLSNVILNGVNIKLTGGDFAISGTSYVTGNNVMFYSTGGGQGFHFNGNSSNTLTNTTFYLETGSAEWNGNVGNTFTAQTSGPYANLLIYMPYGNQSQLKINGNSGNSLTGTILAISAPIEIRGNSGTASFHSQIIGYTVTLAGNSNTTINYVDAENFDIPAAPTIELTR
jgi:Flp pilus assembly protein TadG